MKPELSLYLHFPFCKRKCLYCDFNSYSGIENLIPEYIESLILEIGKFLPEHRVIRSVYFGGGTPSYFPVQSLVSLLRYLKEHFLINHSTEITIEANPGTITAQDLIVLYEAGFNRLSLGVQAAQDELLTMIGRIHTWQDFLSVYQQAREVGFDNIGVDLICGLPGQTLEDWQDSLQRVVFLEPEHISAYALQLEPNTPLAKLVGDGTLTLPVEEEVVSMMQTSMGFLQKKGYEHYEISNYARQGYRSIHNVGYWTGRDYLGFGAGAASTFHQCRWTNVCSPQEYIQRLKDRRTVALESETIDPSTAITEAIMLGLRMRSGIDLARFKEQFQFDLSARAGERIEVLKGHGLLTCLNEHLALTDQGVLVSNYVISSILAAF